MTTRCCENPTCYVSTWNVGGKCREKEFDETLQKCKQILKDLKTNPNDLDQIHEFESKCSLLRGHFEKECIKRAVDFGEEDKYGCACDRPTMHFRQLVAIHEAYRKEFKYTSIPSAWDLRDKAREDGLNLWDTPLVLAYNTITNLADEFFSSEFVSRLLDPDQNRCYYDTNRPSPLLQREYESVTKSFRPMPRKDIGGHYI